MAYSHAFTMQISTGRYLLCSAEAATPAAMKLRHPRHCGDLSATTPCISTRGPTPTASFDLLNQGDIMVTCTRLFSAETCCSKSHIPTQQLGFYLPITYLSGTSMGRTSGQPSRRRDGEVQEPQHTAAAAMHGETSLPAGGHQCTSWGQSCGTSLGLQPCDLLGDLIFPSYYIYIS